MKKVLLLTAAVMLLAVPAMAGIVNTRHNLGTTGTFGYGAGGTSEICVFCHTPHNASIKVPIWNRAANTSAFKVYTGSASFDGTNGSKTNLEANAISRLCLSCHETMSASSLADGAVNDGSRGAITVTATVAGNTLGGKASLGTDLSNDHPVNFALGTDAGIINTSTTDYKMGTGAVFPLYKGASAGEYLECASCHDPHAEVAGGKFLRKTNGTSALCLTCHTK